MNLASTSIAWLISGFGIVALISIVLTLKAWREAKHSPYFFMRRQAQRLMQQYATVSAVMILLTAGTSVYSWAPPADTIPRFATLTNAKPVAADITLDELLASAPVARDSLAAALADAPVAAEGGAPEASGELAADVAPIALVEATAVELPDAYRTVHEAKVEMGSGTRLGAILFSREIDEAYTAVDPVRLFEPGFYTIYGTFEYDGMADGMEWAWVWLRDGEVVSGGTQLWAYGDTGPGYVYFNPEDGFQAGDYTLQVWVNEELLTQSSLTITTAAASR